MTSDESEDLSDPEENWSDFEMTDSEITNTQNDVESDTNQSCENKNCATTSTRKRGLRRKRENSFAESPGNWSEIDNDHEVSKNSEEKYSRKKQDEFCRSNQSGNIKKAKDEYGVNMREKKQLETQLVSNSVSK